jgi:hypothetical protein
MRESRTSGSQGGPGRVTARVYPTELPRDYLHHRRYAGSRVASTRIRL